MNSVPSKATGIGGMMFSSHQAACELGSQLWSFMCHDGEALAGQAGHSWPSGVLRNGAQG